MDDSRCGEDWADLGRGHTRSGQFEAAEACFARALSQGQAIDAEAWAELGLAYAVASRFSDAVRAFALASQADPEDAVIRANLGNALRLVGRLEEAERELRRSIVLSPELADAHGNLGLALTLMGRHSEAIACHDRSVSLGPEVAASHLHRGIALAAVGRSAEAEAALVRALELDPGETEAMVHLGLLRGRLGDLEGSLRIHQLVASLRPGDPEACNNLGSALRALGRVEEAAAWYERALDAEPRFAEAISNLGIARLQNGNYDEADTLFDRAVTLKPELVEAHVNRAHAWLGAGDVARGWREFEWRRLSPMSAVRQLPGREWTGTPLFDQIIVLHAEQGLGDTLQFVRFAAAVGQRGGRPWLRVPRQLASLLSRCPGVERVIAPEDPVPPEAIHVPLMSLPYRLNLLQLEEQGGMVPYLFEDAHLADAIEPQLGAASGLRVGLAWQGNPRFPEDWHRSIPLKALLPLSRVEGIQCIVLQRGPGLEQLDALSDCWQPQRLMSPNEEEWGWENTAAVISRLDLVITSDSAIAHLAGAMGRPAWVVLSAAADWRWLRDRGDSPWYPTVRLFRQTTWRVWDDPVQRIVGELLVRLSKS